MNIIMKLFFILLSFLWIPISFSQKGEVTIKEDSRINALIDAQSNVPPNEINPQINGFRIQLFFDSDKSLINTKRAYFISIFPKIDTYTTYTAPNFFLKVGDFRTRLEAEKIKAEIEAQFPTSFIIKEKINLPRLAE